MGFMDWINEQLYIVFSTYYYEVFLYKDNVQVGRIIQTLNFSPDFIVDFKRKLCWPIIKGVGHIKGHKIILHYKLDFALPLAEVTEENVLEINSALNKIQTITKLTGTFTKEEIAKSKGMSLVTAYNFPPHMLFELFNAHFVTKTLSKGKTTDWTMIVLAICAVIFLLGFMAIMVFGVGKGVTPV